MKSNDWRFFQKAIWGLGFGLLVFVISTGFFLRSETISLNKEKLQNFVMQYKEVTSVEEAEAIEVPEDITNLSYDILQSENDPAIHIVKISAQSSFNEVKAILSTNSDEGTFQWRSIDYFDDVMWMRMMLRVLICYIVINAVGMAFGIVADVKDKKLQRFDTQ